MPTVEKSWNLFNAAAVFINCRWQFPNRQVSVSIIEELFNFRGDFFHWFLGAFLGDTDRAKPGM